MSTDRWVTPAQAVRLVVIYSEVGSEHGARNRLMGWIAHGQLKTTAMEATRHVYRRPELPAQPPEPRNDLPHGVQPIGAPISSFDLPLTQEVERGYMLTVEDWRLAAADPSTQWETVFSDSQLEHRLPAERNPNSRVVYAGLRFSVDDIDLRIELAGWKMPVSQPAETVEADRSIPANRQLDHDDLRRRAAEMLVNQPNLSKGSAAASIVADLGNNPRTGRAFDARGIEKIISTAWGGG